MNIRLPGILWVKHIDTFFFLNYWFTYIFLALLGLYCFVGLFLVVLSRDYSLFWCMAFSLWWLLLLRSIGCRHMGFSSCVSQALECGLNFLWCTDSAALRHEKSSRTRSRTCVTCIGRKISIHCTTKEKSVDTLWGNFWSCYNQEFTLFWQFTMFYFISILYLLLRYPCDICYCDFFNWPLSYILKTFGNQIESCMFLFL